MPLKQDAALAGVLAVEVGHHRRGDRDRTVVGDDRDRAASQPAAESAQRLVVQRGVEYVAIEQAGEVAAHQHATHLVGGHTVQGQAVR